MPKINPYTPPQSQPLVVTIFGMSLLGIAAMMAQWVKDGWLSQWGMPYAPICTLLLCGIIGAFVGAVSIPFVATSFMQNDWLATATKIYGVNGLLVVAYVVIKPTGLTGPLSAAVVAFIGVVTMAQVMRFTKI